MDGWQFCTEPVWFYTGRVHIAASYLDRPIQIFDGTVERLPFPAIALILFMPGRYFIILPILKLLPRYIVVKPGGVFMLHVIMSFLT